MINFNHFTLIIENLKKVKNFVNNNIEIKQEDTFIIEIIYKKLNEGVIKLGKPIYVTWLFSLYLKEKEKVKDYKKHKWFLDLNKLITSLEIYQRNISKIPKNLHLKFVNKKDEKPSFNYPTINDFVLMVDGKVEESISSKLMNDSIFINKKEAEVILDNKNVKVIEIFSQAAADFYGQESNWCTVSSKGGSISNYTPNLYIVFNKRLLETKNPSRIIQIHFHTDQIMDLNDKFDSSILKEKSINKLFKKEIGNIDKLTIDRESEDRFIRKVRDLDVFYNLKKLRITDIEIENLPEEIFNIKNLERLSIIRFPKLKSIPEKIGELKNLKHLDISLSQSFTDIPKSLFTLKELKILNIHNTSIKKLPFSFKSLTSLTELSISGSLLKEVPKDLHLLSNLKKINLSNNQITKLPSNLKDNTSLYKFDVRNNKIETIDSDLINKSSFTIDFSKNPIALKLSLHLLLKESTSAIIYEDSNIKILDNNLINNPLLDDYISQIKTKITQETSPFYSLMVIDKNLKDVLNPPTPIFLNFNFSRVLIDELNFKYVLNPVIAKNLKEYYKKTKILDLKNEVIDIAGKSDYREIFSYFSNVKELTIKSDKKEVKISKNLIQNILSLDVDKINRLMIKKCEIDSFDFIKNFNNVIYLGLIDIKNNKKDNLIIPSTFNNLQDLSINNINLIEKIIIKNNRLTSFNFYDEKNKVNLEIESPVLDTLTLNAGDLVGLSLKTPNISTLKLAFGLSLDTISKLKSNLKGFDNLKPLSAYSHIEVNVSDNISNEKFQSEVKDFLEIIKNQLKSSNIEASDSELKRDGYKSYSLLPQYIFKKF